MAYFLGIDQGGSKTVAIVGDECGHILGMGHSHGAIHSSDGMDKAMDACNEACREAVSKAGLELRDISLIAGGLSGIDWEDEEALVTEALRRTLENEHVIVVNDCIIAMRAGTAADNCGILCAGSGLNCAVRAHNREIVFGFYIPDSLQGGTAIAQRALQKVFDAEAGVLESTELKKYFLEYFGVNTVDALLRMKVEQQMDYQKVLYLPQIVEKAALEGDEAANDVFREFAEGIVPYLISGMRQLNILDKPADIVLSGSAFKCKAPVLMDTVIANIRRSAKKARIIDAIYEPVIGAYLLALDQYHGESSTQIFEAIKDNTDYRILRKKGGFDEKDT